MVGQLAYVTDKGRARLEEGMLGPLPVLRWTVYEPPGWPPGGWSAGCAGRSGR